MNGFGTTMRRALGRARRFPTQLARTGCRPVAALGLATTLLTTALVPAAPVSAADQLQEPPKPAARVQVVVQGVHVYDDRDPGDGEMHFEAHLSCTAVSTPCLGQPRADLDDYERNFSAMTGETVPFDNHVLPDSAPTNPAYAASADTGYPLYPGNAYELDFSVFEQDLFTAADLMGDRHIMLTQENGWAIGTYKLRSTLDNRWGDYEVEFEVRRAPLPDLRATDLKVYNVPSSTKKLVCVAIDNVGPVDADSFNFWLAVDGQVRPEGAATAGKLAAGASGELCGQSPVSLSPGTHQIQAFVDPEGSVVEYDETNNSSQRTYTSTSQPASASDQQTPAADLADLTIGAIKVNGQVPDGKDDCKDGKSPVTVVVKNTGAAGAAKSTVRLVVDDDQDAALEQTAAEVEAGKEREVRFDDVRLKKGQHKLTAIVDAKGGVEDSNDDNNSRSVTASCRDDG